MSLGKKLLVSAVVAVALVVVSSTIVIAAPRIWNWNTSTGFQANTQQDSYAYNQRSRYDYEYGGYNYGGCMGGGYRRGSYGPATGYASNGAVMDYDFVEVSGILDETHWSYIVLDVEGKSLQVHGPAWFWNIINPETGSDVEVVGVLVWSINRYGETFEELTPFQLTIDETTYGDADLGMPVWHQRDT